eukprot:COSAG06_NODE_4458_length_4242_cov_1.617186_3_plen_297_part_00
MNGAQVHWPSGMKRDGPEKWDAFARKTEDKQAAAAASERPGHCQGPSEFVGVNWHKKGRKWVAGIGHNGKSKYLGSFDDEHGAAQAYDTAARRLRGDDAHGGQSIGGAVKTGRPWRLNFPTKGEVKRAQHRGRALLAEKDEEAAADGTDEEEVAEDVSEEEDVAEEEEEAAAATKAAEEEEAAAAAAKAAEEEEEAAAAAKAAEEEEEAAAAAKAAEEEEEAAAATKAAEMNKRKRQTKVQTGQKKVKKDIMDLQPQPAVAGENSVPVPYQWQLVWNSGSYQAEEALLPCTGTYHT